MHPYTVLLLLYLSAINSGDCIALPRYQNATRSNAPTPDARLSSASCTSLSTHGQVHLSPEMPSRVSSLFSVTAAWSSSRFGGPNVDTSASRSISTYVGTASDTAISISKPSSVPARSSRRTASDDVGHPEHLRPTSSAGIDRPVSAPRRNVTTTNSEPNPPNHISKWKVLSCFIALSLNAATQRSGADEMPWSGSVSLARLSPLICLADVIVAIVTIVWCMFKEKRACKFAIAVYFHHNHRTEVRGNSSGQNSPEPSRASSSASDKFLKLITGGSSLLAALVIFCTEGIDARTFFCALVFFASPVIYFLLWLFKRDREACHEAQKYINEVYNRGQGDPSEGIPGKGEPILQYADAVWCLAYAIQFASWVNVGLGVTALPALSGERAKWTNGGILCLVSVAILVSSCCKERMYKLWSIRNWEWTQINYCLFTGFTLLLAANVPDNPMAREIWMRFLVPLGTFAIVVLEIFTATFITDLVVWLDPSAAGVASRNDLVSDVAPESTSNDAFRLTSIASSEEASVSGREEAASKGASDSASEVATESASEVRSDSSSEEASEASSEGISQTSSESTSKEAPVPVFNQNEAPEVLQKRLNPMLNSTPDRWRFTLMVAFMLCQFTFAILHYGLLYDGSDTSVPAWVNAL